MPGKLLRVRLPADHWIWNEPDAAARSAEVKEALEFYRRFGQNIEAVRQAAQEIKDMLRQGVVLAANDAGESAPQEDPRFAALDKFLEF